MMDNLPVGVEITLHRSRENMLEVICNIHSNPTGGEAEADIQRGLQINRCHERTWGYFLVRLSTRKSLTSYIYDCKDTSRIKPSSQRQRGELYWTEERRKVKGFLPLLLFTGLYQMDHHTALGDDEVSLLFERVISITSQAAAIDDSDNDLENEKYVRVIGPDDLEQAILRGEKLASQDQDHFKVSPTRRFLGALKEVAKLFSFHVCHSCLHSFLVPPQIMFEKQEIDVDDIEAPLPDPFDYLEKPVEREAHANGVSGLEDGVLGLESAYESACVHSVLVPPNIMFEKQEINVDDIEAPLPDPFDYLKQPVGREAHANGVSGLEDGVLGLEEGEREGKGRRGGEEGGGSDDNAAEVIPMGAEDKETEKCEGKRVSADQNEAHQKEQNTKPEWQKAEFMGSKRKRESKIGELKSAEAQSESIREAMTASEDSVPALKIRKVSAVGINHSEEIDSNPTGHSDWQVCPLHKPKEVSGTDELQEAILYVEKILKATPEDHHRLNRLENLANVFVLRYEQTGAIADLRQAISYSKEVLKITPRDHPYRAFRLKNLASKLISGYHQTGAMCDLQQAILYSQEALVLTPPGHSYRSCCLNDLASSMTLKYEGTRDIDDLQKAISYSREALAATPQDHPCRANHVKGLACALSLRYEETEAMDDLQQAILYSREVLALTPPEHHVRSCRLDDLSTKLSSRYLETGAMDDLQEAILYGEEALAATPQDHPCRVNHVKGLAHTFSLRYEETEAMDDLQQAILYSREVLALTPPEHHVRSCRLDDLSTKLSSRYLETGAMDDLQEAILYGEEALETTPQDHPCRASHLSNLADILYARYKQGEAMDDLQQAIIYDEEALAATLQDSPGRIGYLESLERKLCSRYEKTGVMDDLQRAILYSTEVLAATPQDHPYRARRLKNLSSRLASRYVRINTIGDIQQAILYCKEVLEVTPKDHPSRACYLSDLANRLIGIYGRAIIEDTTLDNPDSTKATSEIDKEIASEAMNALQQAILYAREAFEMTTEGDPHRAYRLRSLALVLDWRYEQTQTMDDLQQAILYGEEALAETPQDDPNRAHGLHVLSFRLRRRFELTGNFEDISKSIQYLRESWACSTSSPFQRVSTAKSLAHAFHTLHMSEDYHLKCLFPGPEEPSSVLADAVLLLPRVTLRSLGRQDQQYNLLKLHNLAEAAASAALSAGKSAYDALKLLELSCGIIIGFSIDCRGDLSDLRETDPKLFEKFNGLRTEIDTPFPDRSEGLVDTFRFNEYNRDRAQAIRNRERAALEMEETIAKIRNLPGHEGFQLPPSPKELMSMAKDGPIVTFFSTCTRSDAIIVTSSAISSILLPKLDYHEIPDRLGKIAKLAEGKLRTYASRNKEMQEVLLWLWDVAVEPVVRELQLEAGSADLAHIWWIGVGSLSMAPFHAAGNYSTSDPSQNIFNYAISSYTPTIKALSYAREKDLTITNDSKLQLLLVTMPNTPGEIDLPNVDKEVAEILEVTKDSVLTEHLEQPSAKDILDRLGSCNAMHFACHGISNSKDPSSSHLVLLKKDKADPSGGPVLPEADRLTVKDISSRNTKVAQLAYLSACSTARNSAARLANETIHIASGFQLAGFNHVLAAMWPSESIPCKEISVEFYRTLFDCSDPGDGHRKVRIAFYKAVKKVQEKHPCKPLKWAPFIHMGA